MSDFSPPLYRPVVGDRVMVMDEGLAMLRRLCPGLPPNHHASVMEVWEDEALLMFDDTLQGAPYPFEDIRPLADSTPTPPVSPADNSAGSGDEETAP